MAGAAPAEVGSWAGRSPAQLFALSMRLWVLPAEAAGAGAVKGLGLPVLTGQRQSRSLPGG